MCGIFGLIATKEKQSEGLAISPARIARALRLMTHRGPDCSRLSFFSPQGAITVSASNSDLSYIPTPYAALGHNRLSIIDLSENANQPMPHGELWLSYNGEIYNYKDLRAVVEEQDYTFQSQSDTEVLLALYAVFGVEMVHRLNGMFAFGLWDNAHKQLFLARDRYGIKPLYYTFLADGTFAFASEIKALAALPGFDKTLDYTALSEHLTFQNTFGGKTLFKNIRMLEPGHWARLNAETGEFIVQRYWEPVFNPQNNLTESDIIEQLRYTFEQAVNRQLVGDVPIGSFLSGGMDTAAITAIATGTIPQLHTFTAGFNVQDIEGEERLFDESVVSRELAAQLHTRHHEMLIESNAMTACLPHVVWHLDDFRAGISYQNYLVSRMVQESVTVVLSGVGGDELFAGYPWRYEPLLELEANEVNEHYYQSWVRLLSESEKRSLWAEPLQVALNGFSTRDSFDAVFANCKAEHPLDKALCFDMQTFLHGLLVVEDRLSMAHSVESRVPFLDNTLVDFCLTLPWHTKLRDGTAKWILKEALRGLLPDAVLQRRKQGFTPPDASWYRTLMRPYIEELVLSPQALDRGLFQPSALRQILDAHFNGERNHRFLIWSLMCLEWWQRFFVDADEPAAPPPLTELTGARIL